MTEEAIYKIQLYLAGEMTAAEKALFEIQLKEDVALNQLFTTYQAIEHSMIEKTDTNESELKVTLENMGKKYFSATPPSTTVKLWPKLLAVAAILVVVVAVLFVLNNNSKQQDLYATYAQHQPLLVQERANTVDSLANIAAVVFNEKKYAESIDPLKKYLSLQPDDQFSLALAIAQLETNDFAGASNQLDYLIEKNSAFKNEALWYKILLELKRKDNQLALEAIEKLPSTSKHYNAAIDIKNKLLKE